MREPSGWFCLLTFFCPVLIPLVGLIFETWVRFYAILRKEYRQSCGRCIHCGYSVRGNGSGVCPECGNFIPPHHRLPK